MAIDTLQSRLSKESKTGKHTLNLISKLSRLSTSSQPNQTLTSLIEERVELSQAIQSSLKQQVDSVELLQQDIEDFEPGPRGSEREQEKAQLQAQGLRISEDLKLAQAQFRKAQLAAKKNEEATRRKEREQLLAGAASRAEDRRASGKDKLSQNDLAVNASEDVTASLRRAHELMQSELGRSQFAHETLLQSTRALKEINEQQGTLGDLLKTSRSLVSSLIRSSKSDTWYLWTALIILVSTFVWLVVRRVLWIGVVVAIIFPVKSLYWLSSSLFGLASTRSDVLSVSHSSSIIMAQPSGPQGTIEPQATKGEEDQNRQETSGGPLSEKVGDMAQKSQDESQGTEQLKPNPKKRMFEADKEAQKEADRRRDEL